jgi:hypothetical protein
MIRFGLFGLAEKRGRAPQVTVSFRDARRRVCTAWSAPCRRVPSRRTGPRGSVEDSWLCSLSSGEADSAILANSHGARFGMCVLRWPAAAGPEDRELRSMASTTAAAHPGLDPVPRSQGVQRVRGSI